MTSAASQVSLRYEPIGQIAGLGSLLRRLEDYAEPFVLGDFSVGGAGRYSYLGVNPVEVITFEAGSGGDPFGCLESAGRKFQRAGDIALPVPFVAGYVGYLSYDLNRFIERLPDGVRHDIPLPLLRMAFYDAVCAWDRKQQKGYLLALQHERQITPAEDRLEQLRKIVAPENHGFPAPADRHHGPADFLTNTRQIAQRMASNFTRQEYLAAVEQAREYILDGEIFEVNLSQRFRCPYTARPGELYRYLADHNPAGYAALLRAGEHSMVSASPELFLSRRGEQIVTRPIKGTMPRGLDEPQDRQNRLRLEQSVKDRAELNMIIDLERNDLGRVCRDGTVTVPETRTIEAHPTVFHAVATVQGTLCREVSVADILRATFPGGSITGAPKIRSMQIIDELEPTARSVYTGSIGWFGVNGDFDLNIAIRTIILAEQTAYVQVGGAVVADSDPSAEYDETLAKATALLHALQATSK